MPLLDNLRKFLNGSISGILRKSPPRKINHPHAIFYTHGKGTKIYDVDGNGYLDFTLSQGPLILGHSHPKVIKAVQEYSELGQLFAGQHIQELEHAEKLQEIIPSAELMRFVWMDQKQSILPLEWPGQKPANKIFCALRDIIMARGL